MKSKLLLILPAVAALAIGVVGISAYEAHVINVTAHIENATEMLTGAISFSTVFPEEVLYEPATITLSDSFKRSDALGVDYVIKQKPKCICPASVGAGPTVPGCTPGTYAQVTEDRNGNFFCPAGGYVKMSLLCPYLSKTSPNTDDKSVLAFHGPIDLASWTDAVSKEFAATGHLTQANPSTQWNIDLHVPCFKGQCAQDALIDPAYQLDPSLNGQTLGCDLWFEVTNIVRD